MYKFFIVLSKFEFQVLFLNKVNCFFICIYLRTMKKQIKLFTRKTTNNYIKFLYY